MCGLHFEHGRIEDGRRELGLIFSDKNKIVHDLIANEVFPIAIQQHHAGRVHIALELYKVLLKHMTGKNKANVYANIGLAERDRGNQDGAMRSWQAGLEVDPLHGNILRMTGQMYHEMKYLNSARETYLKVLGNEEKVDASVLGNLCDLERQLDNIDTAHDYCTKALENNMHLHTAKSALGSILYQKSKLSAKPHERRELLRDAKRHLGEAITHAPHLTSAWTNYGLVMEELEEFDTAFKAFTKATLLAPRDPIVSYLTNFVPYVTDQNSFVAGSPQLGTIPFNAW